MPVPMTPEAITARLRRASQLRTLCLLLGRARPVPPAERRPKLEEAPKRTR